jgi:hypothetical protein
MPQALTTAPVAAVLATVVAVVVEVLVLATRFSVVNAAEGTSAAFLTPLEQRVMSQPAATLAIAMMAIAKEVALAALVPVLFLPLQSMHRQNLTKQQQPQTTMRLGGGPKTLRPT